MTNTISCRSNAVCALYCVFFRQVIAVRGPRFKSHGALLECVLAVATYNWLSVYCSMRCGRGGEGGGGGGGGWEPRPRVRMFWKLMSVCVALSTQSGMATRAQELTPPVTAFLL